MAENTEPTVEVELLADGIRLKSVDYVRGDVVTLSKAHAEILRKHGSVGPKGTIAKQEKAEADAADAERRRQQALAGLGDLTGSEPVEAPRSTTRKA